MRTPHYLSLPVPDREYTSSPRQERARFRHADHLQSSWRLAAITKTHSTNPFHVIVEETVVFLDSLYREDTHMDLDSRGHFTCRHRHLLSLNPFIFATTTKLFTIIPGLAKG